MTDQVAWWIESAKRDEEMGRLLMSHGYYEGAVAHIHQSAVKLLKAVEIRKEIKSNLLQCVKILEGLAAAGIPSERAMNFARKLDLYYSDSRYPVSGPLSKAFDETMIAELLLCLERIQSFSGELLGPGTL